MNSNINKLFYVIFLQIVSFGAFAQPGYFIDLSWHGKTTTMNHAYGSYLTNSEGIKEIQIHRDGFFSNQAFFHVGFWDENQYARADVAGMFYLMAGLLNNTTGFAKGKFRHFDELAAAHPDEIIVPEEFATDRVIPVSGGGDIRFMDVIGAWGNESMKFGGHLAYGFLGANGGSNGLSFSNGPIQSAGIQTFNLGFWEYGINGMYHPLEDVDAYVNLRLSRMSRVSTRFEKRNGFGIELEGHYRLGHGKIQPYGTIRYQMRNMKGGNLEYFNSFNQPVVMSRSISHTLAIGVGISVSLD